ncbi:hypothetical protein V6N12_044920 [Hibiscus sabdariffa]|uniref:Secreted protein n=1 Tax=Hibiscus sabdariffa TaxID=183260 RepID=A0ABR2G1A9_9ROSI
MLVDFLIFGCFAGSTSGSLVTSLLLPFTALNISSKPYASVAVTHRGGVTVGLGLGRIERAEGKERMCSPFDGYNESWTMKGTNTDDGRGNSWRG